MMFFYVFYISSFSLCVLLYIIVSIKQTEKTATVCVLLLPLQQKKARGKEILQNMHDCRR